MISERIFAAQFSDFWRGTLPNLEVVTRSANLGYERISGPVQPKTNPFRRDLISESGHRLFFELVRHDGRDWSQARAVAVAKAREFLAQSVVDRGEPIDDVDDTEAAEIDNIARWLDAYFLKIAGSKWRRRIAMPEFKGHGIIAACNGDFEVDNSLIEMKYVDRGFRSHDLRQALLYAALRYFENGTLFENIRMVNPFKGVAFTTNPREIIYSASGTEVLEFFQVLSYVASSGEMSH
jgi:hypothetical protein